MTNKFFYLAFFLFIPLLFQSCSSSKESEFNGKWKIKSEYFTYDEPSDKGFNDYFVFNDGQYLRTMADDYQARWESEAQRYEIKDDKFIMYTKLSGFEMNTAYSYEFTDKTRLKLVSDDIGDYEGEAYQYIFILDRIGDE